MQKYVIKQILIEQQAEADAVHAKPFVSRIVDNSLIKAINDPIIKVITGVRRCGKSTLAHQLLKERGYGYINFDDERLISITAQELQALLETVLELKPNTKNLLLDEIQNVAGWELFVNRLMRQGYNVVITGSNAHLLSKELATHLTGRHIALELFPFSFKEFLRYKNVSYTNNELYLAKKRADIRNFFDEYRVTGGMPEGFSFAARDQYLRDLFDKIISRDIVTRHALKYARSLKELSVYALSQFGNPVSYHALKNVFYIGSVHTIKNYLAYLEDAYMLFQLYPFSFKIKSGIKSRKKLYSIDTGLLRALSLHDSPNRGRILENIVFLELRRNGKDAYYYITKQRNEVDFAVRLNGSITELMQVCFALESEKTKIRECRALLQAHAELGCDNLLLLTDDYEGEEMYRGTRIHCMPVWKWLVER